MSSGTRRYGGLAAEERTAERRARLLDAGLELLGTKGAAATTVRGVTAEAGIAARYFYESFGDIDQFQLAVFEEIAVEAADRALGALAAVPVEEGHPTKARIRAVLAEMVDLMLDDVRKGRVVLIESVASPVLGPRVLAESRRFAGMLAATAASGDPLAVSAELPPDVGVIAQFLIGGVAQTFGAVLNGDLDVERERLVDILVDLFDHVIGEFVRTTVET